MTCIIDNRQNEHIYKQPEYNFMEYCVPDKFAEFFKNSCEKPFIMTISETMKHNTLKYFGIKLNDSSSYKSQIISIDDIISKLINFKEISNNSNDLIFNSMDILLHDFEENIHVYNIKQQFEMFDKKPSNIIIYYCEKYNVIINGPIIIIKHNLYPLVIIQKQNITFYLSYNTLITYNDALCFINIKRKYDDKLIASTYMSSPKFIQNTNYELSHKKIIKKYIYKSLKRHNNIVCVSTKTPNKMLTLTSINDNLTIRHFINKRNEIDKIISQCMFSDSNTGLRFRGKYTQISDKNNTNTELSIDDKTVFKKENNNVVIDTITAKRDKYEYVIGWKLGKSESGKNRIIKLGIPHDCKIVMPITDDFFILHRKERCDKAIVLDIQEPLLDEIKSVVPRERAAYSCISDKSVTYSVGSYVLPDSFDDNIETSCTNGIHFHRNRKAVFKLWIPEFSNILISS
jgi:hypothetical protein